MNSAKFHLMRNFLGLSAQDVATALGVHWRTVQRWETTHQPPARAATWITQRWERAREEVDATIEFVETQRIAHGAPESLDLTIPSASEPTRQETHQDRTPGERRALQAMIAFEAADTAHDALRPSDAIGFTVSYETGQNKTTQASEGAPDA